MLAAWMIYCTALTVLLAGGALLVEKLVHLHRGATRRVWVVALLGAVLAPVFIWLQDIEGGSEAMSPSFSFLVETADPVILDGLGGTLETGWMTLTGLMLLYVGVSVFRGFRGKKAWRRETVDGVPVLVSRDVGPAVVGFFPGRIVLPEWALSVDAAARRLILDHEKEHLRGRDPQLLFLMLVLVAAMPWNPALWWMANRLRLAVEVDCDGRVLAGGDWDAHTYGNLLLTVGGRRSRWSQAVAAFSKPRSALEHRILRMTDRKASARWLKSGALIAATSAVLVGAWMLPKPPPLSALTAGTYWSLQCNSEAGQQASNVGAATSAHRI